MNNGLKIKYNVYKITDDSVVSNCFVLRPDKDEAALEALKTYAYYTKNQELADDLNKWIEKLEWDYAVQYIGDEI